MINREILKNASENYDGDKYSEEFYKYHLEEIRNAQEISESVIRAVEYLFLWKLGKVRLKQTPSSSQLKVQIKGFPYYSIRTTKTHYEVIKKSIENERLKTAIFFRNGEISYDKFKFYASSLTSSTIVLPAFYIHIWHPDKYPILDEKVWKVFCFEKGSSISNYTKPKSFGDFEAYTSFFRKLVDDTGLDFRTVDRGLWVLGDRLKESMRSQNIKFHEGEKFSSLDYDNQDLKLTPIPPNLLYLACNTVSQKRGEGIPFKDRGIMIKREMIKITMELLNGEPTKTLQQNCRNDVRERTPDGLDKRIKENLDTDLRTANIISDVLKQAGIVEVIPVKNPQTGRTVKGTKLLEKWNW